MAFDPAAPRYWLRPGESVDDYAVGPAQVQPRGRSAGDIIEEDRARRAKGDVTVFLPLSLSGLPAGAMPWADRAMVTLRGEKGPALFQGRGDALKTVSSGLAYEAIRIPALVYEAAKDRPLSLRIDYSLSVLKPGPALTAPALGADLRAPGFGRCTTGRDEDGDEIALRCIKPGAPPSCMSSTLEVPASGRRNPETLICAPDYAPYDQRPFPDALGRFEVETPFRDRLGLSVYPVGVDQLATARVVVTPYAAASHAVQRVSAAGVRLADWAVGPGGRG